MKGTTRGDASDRISSGGVVAIRALSASSSVSKDVLPLVMAEPWYCSYRRSLGVSGEGTQLPTFPAMIKGMPASGSPSFLASSTRFAAHISANALVPVQWP
jgi:hypothetical protein